MPDRLLATLLRGRPYLLSQVPPGRMFIWPCYEGDIWVHVDRNNPIEAAMLSQTYDLDVTRAIEGFVKSGQVCLDIGANVGAVSLALARRVGTTGKVIAVEPGPPYVARMRQNINLNPALRKRIDIETVGLGEAPGVLRWQPDPNAPYNAWIFDSMPPWRSDTKGLAVRVETLDDLVGRLRLPRLDFVKIDVESMELEVFKGGRRTLAKFRPVVLFESMEWAREYRRKVSGFDVFREIARLLDSLSYDACELTGAGLRPVDWDRPPDNSLAVPRSLAPR